MRPSVKERLLKGIKDVGCWEWQTYLDKKGYGRIQIKRSPQLAHRVSWETLRGAIPDGLYVCHKCDNKRCINPYHLFLGTQKDNLTDLRDKRPALESAKDTL